VLVLIAFALIFAGLSGQMSSRLIWNLIYVEQKRRWALGYGIKVSLGNSLK